MAQGYPAATSHPRVKGTAKGTDSGPESGVAQAPVALGQVPVCAWGTAVLSMGSFLHSSA